VKIKVTSSIHQIDGYTVWKAVMRTDDGKSGYAEKVANTEHEQAHRAAVATLVHKLADDYELNAMNGFNAQNLTSPVIGTVHHAGKEVAEIISLDVTPNPK
jgi:hypothetical protein